MDVKEHNELISEVLSSLKGRASSARFSKRLGFSSNQVHRWLSHHGTLRWKDIIAITSALKIPLEKNFAIEMIYQKNPSDFKSLCSFLLAEKSRTKMAKSCGVSVRAFNKWAQGESSPPFGIILRILRQSHYSLDVFISAIVPPEKQNEKLRRLLQKDRDRKATILGKPWTMAVLCMIASGQLGNATLDQLPQVLHSKLGLDKNLVDDVVRELSSRQILVVHNNRLHIDETHIDMSSEDSKLKEFTDFWVRASLDTTNNANMNSVGRSGYLIFTAGEDEIAEIHDAYNRIFNEVVKISGKVGGKSARTFVYSAMLVDAEYVRVGEFYDEHQKRFKDSKN